MEFFSKARAIEGKAAFSREPVFVSDLDVVMITALYHIQNFSCFKELHPSFIPGRFNLIQGGNGSGK